MVKGYYLLNDYKHWKMGKIVTEADRVTFDQRGTKRGKTNFNNDEWNNNKNCHKCDKKGHIESNCPIIERNNDDNVKSANEKNNGKLIQYI